MLLNAIKARGVELWDTFEGEGFPFKKANEDLLFDGELVDDFIVLTGKVLQMLALISAGLSQTKLDAATEEGGRRRIARW